MRLALFSWYVKILRSLLVSQSVILNIEASPRKAKTANEVLKPQARLTR